MSKKSRYCFVLFILTLLLITASTAKSWPIKSAEKMQKAEKMVTKQVTELAEKDNYFDSSFIKKYTERLMNSINQNNGKGAIIAHDGNRWCSLAFTLDDEENIRQIRIKRYEKNFGEMFKENNIDQSGWSDLIRQFNTSGYGVITTASESVKYYRDFEKDSFVVAVTRKTAGYGNGSKNKSFINDRDTECREKLRAVIEPLKAIINKSDLSIQECREGNTMKALEYTEQILESSTKLATEMRQASSDCKNTSVEKVMTEGVIKLTKIQMQAQDSIRSIREIGCHYQGSDNEFHKKIVL